MLELEAVDEVATVVVEATVPAGLLVDVGLKSFTYVTDPPAEAGSVFQHSLLANLKWPEKKRRKKKKKQGSPRREQFIE